MDLAFEGRERSEGSRDCRNAGMMERLFFLFLEEAFFASGSWRSFPSTHNSATQKPWAVESTSACVSKNSGKFVLDTSPCSPKNRKSNLIISAAADIEPTTASSHG